MSDKSTEKIGSMTSSMMFQPMTVLFYSAFLLQRHLSLRHSGSSEILISTVLQSKSSDCSEGKDFLFDLFDFFLS